MNITPTFSILWPCFHQKNSKHQEMFCHWMLENIDQTFQMSIQCFNPQKPTKYFKWFDNGVPIELQKKLMLYRNHCGNILNTKKVKSTKHLKQCQNIL